MMGEDDMVQVIGHLVDRNHIELEEAIPEGEEEVVVRLMPYDQDALNDRVALLASNPSFDFLRDEPDLYE
jgi:hypothetical protein